MTTKEEQYQLVERLWGKDIYRTLPKTVWAILAYHLISQVDGDIHARLEEEVLRLSIRGQLRLTPEVPCIPPKVWKSLVKVVGSDSLGS